MIQTLWSSSVVRVFAATLHAESYGRPENVLCALRVISTASGDLQVEGYVRTGHPCYTAQEILHVVTLELERLRTELQPQHRSAGEGG